MEGDKEICQHPEEEVRFSVSVKFHMFQSEEEAELYYSGKQEGRKDGRWKKTSLLRRHFPMHIHK